jgi:hypothetical protein
VKEKSKQINNVFSVAFLYFYCPPMANVCEKFAGFPIFQPALSVNLVNDIHCKINNTSPFRLVMIDKNAWINIIYGFAYFSH